jgi:hypothetical protein
MTPVFASQNCVQLNENKISPKWGSGQARMVNYDNAEIAAR